MATSISKLLIANRGEIACRIIRTAKSLGIKTVAVFSEADKNAINVSMSDEAYCIGPAASQLSYLCQDKILNVAKSTRCQAVHPGYGFLSENADFSELCEKEGVIFIGPPASAIRSMGIKSTSKKIMSDANVPIISGYHGDDQNEEKLFSEAKDIGFPIMIKAICGGGGKGMRIAETESDFLAQLHSARRESLNSFGNDAVLLERFISNPRHVEVQVFADHFGNCVYLYERDCSVQRRHQKIIEEAPAPGLNDELRRQIGTAAVRAAKAVGYVGAGTVEFIYESSSQQFFFMEMNTRLQVEHPITEMITSTDLVEWQIKVAEGHVLPLKQENISINGHAVEARIYAEDPNNNFLPTAGSLIHLSTPSPSDHVRVETGVVEGDEVSVHYDPMIAKLVVWGKDRNEAFHKLHNHLLNYHVVGVNTNIQFLATLCTHPEFLLGNVNTDFIQNHREDLFVISKPSSEILAQAALALSLFQINLATEKYCNDIHSPWNSQSSFRINHLLQTDVTFIIEDKVHTANVTYGKNNGYIIKLLDGDEKFDSETTLDKIGNCCYCLNSYSKNTRSRLKVVVDNDSFHIFTPNDHFVFKLKQSKFEENTDTEEGDEAVSPMPGIVDRVLVKVGERVERGDAIMVVIAMKMEYVIKSPKEGMIEEILFKRGDNVTKNAKVVDIKLA